MQTVTSVEGFTLREETFATDDGVELFYRAWLPAGRPARRAVLLFHRGHEHSGRVANLVRELNLPDTAFFAWDARGHGRSPGERGWAVHFGRVVADIDNFVQHCSTKFDIPVSQMAVVGNSVGAVAVAAWVHGYAPPVRAMVLATPAFKVKLYVPFALPGLRLMQRFGRMRTIKSYVKPNVLTHDFAEQQAYRADPLITRDIASNILIDLFDTSNRLLADAGAINVPTFILTAGNDWVVHKRPQQVFCERLASPIKQWRAYPGLYHAIFHEKDRSAPIGDTRAFLVEMLGLEEGSGDSSRPKAATDSTPSAPLRQAGADLLRADVRGYTRYEFDRLSTPLSLLCPRWWYWGMQRLTLSTLGRLSDGITIGWRTGFDSGESLDHVYRNTPTGRGPLGRLIDQQYLNAIGWRGIRQRKVHLQELLRQAILDLREHRPRLHVVDIAAGPGRYALEVLKEMEGPHDHSIHATLRDRSPTCLAQGAEIAKRMGLLNVTFEQGDAFSPESINTITPTPDIAIVSGLYELFSDNTMVLRSLRALGERMSSGSVLIYTNQPWHPQVEMIARVLINREGRPWIMRRRTQAEMDTLIAEAGFEKRTMRIDQWGIFTVSLAVKR